MPLNEHTEALLASAGNAALRPAAKQNTAPKTRVHRRQDKGSGEDDDDDEFSYWRYKDLVERRIIVDRADLWRKQQRGFPRSVKFAKGQGAVALFPVAAVKAWLRENMSVAEPIAAEAAE